MGFLSVSCQLQQELHIAIAPLQIDAVLYLHVVQASDANCCDSLNNLMQDLGAIYQNVNEISIGIELIGLVGTIFGQALLSFIS